MELEAASSREGALDQAFEVADVSLGDVWSEVRRACARGVAKVPLDGASRALLSLSQQQQLFMLQLFFVSAV